MNETTVTITAKKINRIGNLLIGIGFLLPVLATGFNIGSAYEAGEFIGRGVLLTLLAIGVISLITRKMSEVQKSYARLALGVCVVIWAVSSIVTTSRDEAVVKQSKNAMIESYMQATVAATTGGPSAAPSTPAPVSTVGTSPEAQKAVVFLAAMGRAAAKQAADNGNLAKKFSTVNLDNALTPAGLTSRTNINASRAQIRKYLELIQERDTMVEQTSTANETIILQSDLSERDRRSAIDGFKQTSIESLKLAHDLSTAQRDSANKFIEMLDFAELRLGTMSVSDGKVMFATQADVDNYQALYDEVQSAAKLEEAVTQQYLDYQRRHAQSMVDLYNK